MSYTNLTNAELVYIYRFLKGQITRVELARRFSRSRTNTYYYVGQAAAYWMSKGKLRFHGVKEAEDLGGKDIEE